MNAQSGAQCQVKWSKTNCEFVRALGSPSQHKRVIFNLEITCKNKCKQIFKQLQKSPQRERENVRGVTISLYEKWGYKDPDNTNFIIAVIPRRQLFGREVSSSNDRNRPGGHLKPFGIMKSPLWICWAQSDHPWCPHSRHLIVTLEQNVSEDLKLNSGPLKSALLCTAPLKAEDIYRLICIWPFNEISPQKLRSQEKFAEDDDFSFSLWSDSSDRRSVTTQQFFIDSALHSARRDRAQTLSAAGESQHCKQQTLQ